MNLKSFYIPHENSSLKCLAGVAFSDKARMFHFQNLAQSLRLSEVSSLKCLTQSGRCRTSRANFQQNIMCAFQTENRASFNNSSTDLPSRAGEFSQVPWLQFVECVHVSRQIPSPPLQACGRCHLQGHCAWKGSYAPWVLDH